MHHTIYNSWVNSKYQDKLCGELQYPTCDEEVFLKWRKCKLILSLYLARNSIALELKWKQIMKGARGGGLEKWDNAYNNLTSKCPTHLTPL